MHGPGKSSQPKGRYLSLYAKLGVSPNASTDAIHLACQVLAEAYCPDGAYADDAMHQAFSEIRNAAEILGNPKTRKLYDLGHIDDAGRLTEAGLARRRRVRAIGLSGGLLAAAGAAVLIFGFWPSSEPGPSGVQTASLQERAIPTPPSAAVNPALAPKAAAETPTPPPAQEPQPAQTAPQNEPSEAASPPSDIPAYLPPPASRQSAVQPPAKYSPAEGRQGRYAQRLERRKRQEFSEQTPSGPWDTDIWFPHRPARSNDEDAFRPRPASRSASCLACLADGGDCSGICP